MPFFSTALNRSVTLSLALLLCTSLARAAADADEAAPEVTFINNFCIECHSGEKPKGDFSLEDIEPVSKSNTDTWEDILEQVATGEMPPSVGKSQPTDAEKEAVIDRLKKTLAQAGRKVQMPGGPLPTDGNLVDHKQLFSGRHKGPASSPPRFWRRSQPQYDALMEYLWVLPKLRYEKAATRNSPDWAAYSYSQPFTSLDPAHFTNYSGSINADEATLRSLMNAGSQIAERLTTDSPAYSKYLQPPHAVGIPSIRRGSPWERFKIDPPSRPIEFEPFIEAKQPPTAQQVHAAVDRVFQIMLKRKPTHEDAQRYSNLVKQSVEKSGPLAALRGLITAVVVSPEFVFRMEVGMGEKGEHGRRMLSPNELVYAIAYALTDAGPDAALWEAARNGQLTAKADVERQVRRLMADDTIEKNRTLRFFQEFFGYHRAGEVFKERGGWKFEVQYLVRDADMLVEYILKNDKHVFAELLTTDRYFVAYPNIKDPKLFEAIIAHTNEYTEAGIKRTKERGRKIEAPKKKEYNRAWSLTQGYNLIPKTVHNDRSRQETSYLFAYGIDGSTFNWSPKQPIAVPGRRAGILTHPAWLVAHSTNFDNYVVGRGHWIREHLLAGKIPDVPIDVEAQVPDEPDSTLRERMRVTQAQQCIRCHRRMDPLGFPFEIYDHYGVYREKEMVGTRKNQPKPINATGAILESGDEKLDGQVADAIDLVHKLAKSPRVRQSFVRHAFRYWMGRNELLSDSPTLMAADRAYVENEGSFNELLVSLLTSDSFLYRK